MIYLGVDPGRSSGAVAAIIDDEVRFIKLSETESDISLWIDDLVWENGVFAYLEQVAARPGQGVSSMFKFGQSYGFVRGLLVAHGVSFETVTPGVWQRKMGCLSGGDKQVTKARAQELFPQYARAITNKTADALLLAEYCRRQRGASGAAKTSDSQLPTAR